MHDLEQDIRRILDEDAHEAPLISSAPANIARQVRRRQVRFATVASLCTVAIGIGLFVGFRAFTPSDGAVPGETTESIHPGEIASGNLEGVGGWWLAAREADGLAELAFHRPGETDTGSVEAPEHVFAIAGTSFLEPSRDITLPSYWMVMGVVVPQATRVEVRLEGGRTVVAELVPLPPGILGSNKAFIALDVTDDPTSLIPPNGTIVALDASGAELDRQELALPRSSDGAHQAQMDLRNSLVAALTYYTDGATFVGFTPAVAASLEPGLTFNIASEAVTDEISIRDVRKGAIALVTRASDGIVWCIAQQDAATLTTYGVLDARIAADCVGGDDAWAAVSPPTATPSPSASPSAIESSMHAISSGSDLGETWTLSGSLDDQQYCVQLETAGTGSGSCGAPAQGGGPFGPPDDRPALSMTFAVSAGEFVVETVPNSVDRIEVTSPSGETFTGRCADPRLIPKLMARGIRFCVVPLAGSGDGTMRFLAANGTQAFPSRSITWHDEGSAGSVGSSG